jgi:hypothetical protein
MVLALCGEDPLSDFSVFLCVGIGQINPLNWLEHPFRAANWPSGTLFVSSVSAIFFLVMRCLENLNPNNQFLNAFEAWIDQLFLWATPMQSLHVYLPGKWLCQKCGIPPKHMVIFITIGSVKCFWESQQADQIDSPQYLQKLWVFLSFCQRKVAFFPFFPTEIGGTLARAGIRRWRVPVVREEPAGPGNKLGWFFHRGWWWMVPQWCERWFIVGYGLQSGKHSQFAT